LDTELIDHVLENYSHIITIEDGTKLGGFGSAVAEYVAEKGAGVPVKIMGVPDEIVEHGTQRELHDEVGIGPDGIVDQVKRLLGVTIA
jgi:1-deoxy-D-xylulose-5-phosphate synthase